MNSPLIVLIISVLFLTGSCGNPDKTTQQKELAQMPETVPFPKKADRGNIDFEHSVIAWKGTKMLKTGKHEGALPLKDAALIFKNGKLTGGHFTADMRRIRITDIPPEETGAIRNLTNHLNQDFDIEHFPVATFEIKNTEQKNDSVILITGQMAIKGITKNMAFPLQVDLLKNTYKAKLVLSRAQWKIGEKGSWLEKKMVDDEFFLFVTIRTK